MYNFIKTLVALNNDKRAVTALEYGMVAALIAVASATAFSGVATKLGTVLTSVQNAL